MKRSAIAVTLLALAILCAAPAYAAAGPDTEQLRQAADAYMSALPADGYYISPDDLLKRIESGNKDFVLVDCREKIEKYKAGHIPGAIYINAKDIARPESLARLPADKDIILYCNSGHEESKAMAVLGMLGYKVHALKFGYISWAKAMPTDFVLGLIDNAAKKNYPVER